MEYLVKSFEVKAVDDKGHVEGYASTWTETPDSYGDIVRKGAFTETIEKKAATGHPFPLCYGHDFDQIIGKIDSIEEDDIGLKVSATFLDTPLAQEKRELVKEGIVWQFSFAYAILEAETPTREQKAEGIMQILTKLDLYEVSLVPVPANQTAIVTDIKSDREFVTPEIEEKAGRRNSANDEAKIREAISALQALLDNADEGEDEPKANGAPEEPKESNPEKAQLLEFIESMED